jgi:hypothetical protein
VQPNVYNDKRSHFKASALVWQLQVARMGFTTSREFLFVVSALGVILLATHQSSAQAASDRWSGKGTIELNFEPLAVANPTPHGFLGLSASYSPTAWLALSGGLGVGFVGYSARRQPQVSFMPRLRYVREGHAFGFGLGASVGDYFWNETVGDTAGATKLWTPAWRADTEVSYERRWDSGILLRPYLGLSMILNQSAGVCQELREHCLAEHAGAPGFPLLDLGVALGDAF